MPRFPPLSRQPKADPLEHNLRPQTDIATPRSLSPYQRSQTGKSIWQIANSVIPFLLMWPLMIWSLSVSYWLTLGLALVAGGFMVRVFIIFHDCGHGSFFRSRRANEWVGFLTGLLTFTPHLQWWKEHAIHHATAGNLDRRGVGDVWTMTLEEYRAASRWKRTVYWFFRNPLFMFTVGPFLMFVLVNRFPSKRGGRRERMGVLWTNLALGAIVTALCLTIGWKNYLAIHIPVFLFGGAAGVWLFYVQHQFEDVYWVRQGEWDYFSVGMKGSSYYHLPRLLQWFSGNIGFHHIHHLSPRIPNYRLEACHRENPEFQTAPRVTIRTSLKSLGYRLWDEKNRRLVGYSAARERPEPAMAGAARGTAAF